MSWEKFSYICRKASHVLKPMESVSDCLMRVEKEPSCQLYGDHISYDTLSRKTLDDFSKIKDHAKAEKALSVYSDLELTQSLCLPKYFERTLGYFFAVGVVYFIVSGILQLKVLPTFVKIFDLAGIELPKLTQHYFKYWLFYTVLICSALLLSFFLGSIYRQIFMFKQNIENHFIFRFFVFKGIRESYYKIKNLLCYPIQSAIDPVKIIDDEIFAHLSEVEQSGMNLTYELQTLIHFETKKLKKKCEKQMRVMLILVSLTVLYAVSSFLMSLYLPIFKMGQAI